MQMTMMSCMKDRIVLALTALFLPFLLSGCVVHDIPQADAQNRQMAHEKTEESVEKETDPQEKEEAAVDAARKKVAGLGNEVKIAATSPTIADICGKLSLDLAAVCSSETSPIPERYRDVPKIGTAMSPDLELLGALEVDWVLSPVSLMEDLQPKYEALGVDYAFVNTRSVQGMFKSISELGLIFDKEAQAETLVQEFEEFYEKYQQKHKEEEKPSVLILMGLPGSYIVATPDSYVGSLVELAGGKNVYEDCDQEFVNANTEDMKKREPDIILRTCHALPEQVRAMFEEEFEQNGIWKHFKAVKEQKVYDLSYEYFGMSANFSYQKALEELEEILYGKE